MCSVRRRGISTGTGSYQIKWKMIIVITFFSSEIKEEFTEKSYVFLSLLLLLFHIIFGQIPEQCQFLGATPKRKSANQKILSAREDAGKNNQIICSVRRQGIRTGAESHQIKWKMIMVITFFFFFERKKRGIQYKNPAFYFSFCFTSFFDQIFKCNHLSGRAPKWKPMKKKKKLTRPVECGIEYIL